MSDILSWVIILVILFASLYFVIKYAVKNGIVDANLELEDLEKQEQAKKEKNKYTIVVNSKAHQVENKNDKRTAEHLQ